MMDEGTIIVVSTQGFGAGVLDIYAARIDSSGNLLWARSYVEMYCDKNAVKKVSYASQIAGARKNRTAINQKYRCSSCGWH